MIKVKIGEKDTYRPIKYPIIMMSTISNLLVFFTNNEKGTVIRGNSTYEVGHYSASWSLESFKPFNGTITLENDND